jgi:hypothetical protein
MQMTPDERLSGAILRDFRELPPAALPHGLR